MLWKGPSGPTRLLNYHHRRRTASLTKVTLRRDPEGGQGPYPNRQRQLHLKHVQSMMLLSGPLLLPRGRS